MKIVESEIVEIGVEEGVDPGFRIKELCFFQFGVTRGGGTLPLFNVVYVDDNIAVENSTWVSCQ